MGELVLERLLSMLQLLRGYVHLYVLETLTLSWLETLTLSPLGTSTLCCLLYHCTLHMLKAPTLGFLATLTLCLQETSPMYARETLIQLSQSSYHRSHYAAHALSLSLLTQPFSLST